jgi:hypothetical protein
LKFSSDSLKFSSDSLKFSSDSLKFSSDSLKFSSDSLTYSSDSFKISSDSDFIHSTFRFSDSLKFSSDSFKISSDSLKFSSTSDLTPSTFQSSTIDLSPTPTPLPTLINISYGKCLESPTDSNDQIIDEYSANRILESTDAYIRSINIDVYCNTSNFTQINLDKFNKNVQLSGKTNELLTFVMKANQRAQLFILNSIRLIVMNGNLFAETIKFLNDSKLVENAKLDEKHQISTHSCHLPIVATYAIFDHTTLNDNLYCLDDNVEHLGFENKNPVREIEFKASYWTFTDETNLRVSIPDESSQKDLVLLAPINNVLLKVASAVSQIKGLNLTVLNPVSETVNKINQPNITLDESWSSKISFQGETGLSLQIAKDLNYTLKNDQNIKILITHPPPPEDPIYPSFLSDLFVDDKDHEDSSYIWIIILSTVGGLLIVVGLIFLILKVRTTIKIENQMDIL